MTGFCLTKCPREPPLCVSLQTHDACLSAVSPGAFCRSAFATLCLDAQSLIKIQRACIGLCTCSRCVCTHDVLVLVKQPMRECILAYHTCNYTSAGPTTVLRTRTARTRQEASRARVRMATLARESSATSQAAAAPPRTHLLHRAAAAAHHPAHPAAAPRQGGPPNHELL